jgi:hypothetical protein
VRAKRYERAAALRDQREELQRQLGQSGNPTVVQNVKRQLGRKRGHSDLSVSDLSRAKSRRDHHATGFPINTSQRKCDASADQNVRCAA